MSLNLRFYCIYCLWVLINTSCITFASNSDLVFRGEQISEVVTPLIPNCDPSACHNKFLAQLITHGSSSQYDQIIHILNEKGPLCLKFILAAVKDELYQYNELPNTCEGLTIQEDKLSCQNLQAEYMTVHKRVLSLVNYWFRNNQI